MATEPSLINDAVCSRSMDESLNVLGHKLQSCSTKPLTGWYRDGCCNTDSRDFGLHTVCANLTDEFLNFAKESGNDLITPAPQYGFPGLKAGDQWCVCAGTWLAAVNAGVACPVDLEATHKKLWIPSHYLYWKPTRCEVKIWSKLKFLQKFGRGLIVPHAPTQSDF